MKGRIIKQRGMINHMKQASLNSKMLRERERERERETDRQTDRDRQRETKVIMIIRQKVKVNHLKLVGG